MLWRLAVAVLAGFAAVGPASPFGSARPIRWDASIVASDPAWSPDGKRIAFVGRQGSVRFLYVMNADGSARRRVIPGSFDAGWPSWSPDGRRIAFEHIGGTPEQPTTGIYTVGVDGRALRAVVPRGFEPAWSPGGKRIAFVDGAWRIMTVDPDGTSARLVADPGPETGGEGSCESNGYYAPTWSPDGEFVAFAVGPGEGGECGYDVFIGVSRGYGARVHDLADGWFLEPAWSPDGKRVALVEYPPAGGEPPYRVAMVNLTNHAVRRLRAGWHPRWSPDGRRLVFVRGDESGQNPTSAIYVMDADGSHLRRLTP